MNPGLCGREKSFSHVQLFATPWTRLPCPSPTPGACSMSCPKSVMPSNHLILCHPLLLLPSIFPSIKVFSSESVLCIRWPKYWIFSFNISPSNEYSGLISFRMDWLDLLAAQGTFKSLLQHNQHPWTTRRSSQSILKEISPEYSLEGLMLKLNP